MKRKIQQFRLYMVGLAVFLFGGIAWAATNTEIWSQLQSALLNAEELSVIYGNPEDEDPTGTASVAVTLTAGTNAQACTVNEKAGVKVGTSSKVGDMTITIPANTTKLTFYAAAWKGVSELSLNFSGDTEVSFSIDVTSNDGITGNPPFTLSEGTNEDDYKYVLELNDITSETTFSVSAEKRFVIWGASAEVDSEEPNPNPVEDPYDAALAAIGDGGDYYISTDVEGTKYYITADGKLTSSRSDGCIFTLTKVEGNGFKQYGYYIDGGGTRFTNAQLGNNMAVLDVANYSTSTNNRAQWEAQVLFLKDGKYAIRATNAGYGESGWADTGRVFFTWKSEDTAVIPQYTYDEAYQWNLETSTAINVTYLLIESDGTTEVSSVVLKQEGNSEVSVPASLTSNFLYSYTVEGTIGTEDCTITITRTMKPAVTELANLSNDKAYTIASDRGALLVQEDHMYSTALTALADAEPTNFAVLYYDETDDETDNGSYYLYSVSEKKFVLNDGSLAAMPTHGVFDALQMEAKDAPYIFCYFTVAEGTNYAINSNGSNPYGYVINSWMNADGGNQYYMVEADDFDATDALAALYAYFNPSYYVTYVVKDAAGNELFVSEPEPTMLGSKITSLPEVYRRDFTWYDDVDVTISEAETTVEFTAYNAFPFELSTDFATAKWYNMTIRGEWWVGTEGKEDGEGIPVAEPYYPVQQTEDDAARLMSPAYQWAFTGDAYNGIIVWNKGAGEGFTLTSADEMAVMREGEYLWTIGQNSDGFTLRETGTEYNCINQNGGAGGPLTFWKSSGSLGDNGSTFRIFEAPAADPVEFTIKENMNKTGIGSGTQDALAKVKIDTPFKLQATAKNKAANNLKDEDLTIHFDMIMGAAFKSSAWNMNEMSRIVMQDVNVPYAQYFEVPIEFSEEYPYIQSVNFVGAKLMKGDEVIAEFSPEQPFAVRYIEIEHNNVEPNPEEFVGIDEEMPLVYESGQMSSPWSDPSEGTNIDALWDDNNGTFWHTSWHSEPPHNIMGSHFLQIRMPDGYYDLDYYYDGQISKTVEDGVKKIAFKVVRRATNSNHPTRWAVYGTNDPLDFEYDEDAKKAIWDDPMGDRDNCTLLAEITTELTSVGKNDASGETHISEPFDPQGFEYLRFYVDETQSTNGGESNWVYWHAAEMQLYPYIQLDPVEVKIKELEETFLKYEYEPDFYQYKVGTRPGQYSEEAVNNFITAIDDAYELLESLEEITVAQLQEAIDNLNNTYQAVLDSKVPFVLPDDLPNGYYRIRSAMPFINEFRDGDEDDEGEATRQPMEVYKYLYSDVKDGQRIAKWGTPGGDVLIDSLDICREEDVPSLWKVINRVFTDSLGNQVNGLDIINCATGARFTECRRATKLMMTTQPTDTLVAIDLVTDYDETPIFNIRTITQVPKDGEGFYGYFHMSGHAGGAGTEGNIVGWSNSYDRDRELWEENPFGATEWAFEPVDEDWARQIISCYDNSDLLRADEYKLMVRDANEKLPIAKDIQILVDEDNPIVSEYNPIFSPCSDSAEGQYIEYLWDGDGNTWWHSDWHGAFTSEDHHFIQIEVPEGMDLTTAVIKITRRNTTSGNQINKWTVWGTDRDCREDYDEYDGSLLVDDPMVQGSDGLELLTELETPYVGGQNAAEVLSGVFDTKGYKFLRFYCAGTCNNNGSQGYNEQFFHLAEFQLYPGRVVESPTSQYNVMGDIAANLENVINAQTGVVDPETPSQEAYDELKEAYDAFIAMFVDPTPLRSKIKEVRNVTAPVVVGTQPGFWSDRGVAGAIENTIAEAKAYDQAGAYDQEQSNGYIETLDALTEQLNTAAVNPVLPNKWYRFRFATEEEFDQYGWDKRGNEPSYLVIDEDTMGVYDEAIFGKYITVAKSENVEMYEDWDNVYYSRQVVPMDKEAAAIDDNIYADADEDILDKDMSMFRFIPMGEGFAIQNKATGLYLQRKAENSYIVLSVQPSIFTQQAAGYGQNAFLTENLDGTEMPPLHLLRANNILATWANYADARRGCFYVEEVEDVAADYAINTTNLKAWPGEYLARCYPVTVSADPDYGTMYIVTSLEKDQDYDGQLLINMAPLADNVAPAGMPFIFIANGDYTDPSDREEYEEPMLVPFTFDSNFVSQPMNDSPLYGSFYSTSMDRRVVTVEPSGFSIASSNYPVVATNRAVIADTEAINRRASIDVFFSDDPTSLEKMLAYRRAMNSIEGGEAYRISTEVNGATYYLNNKGYLTDKFEEAAAFNFNQVWGENDSEYEYGFWMESGGQYFTNAPGTNEQALISGHISQTSNNRYQWEAQVLFMNEDGKYAVRSTNAPHTDYSWGLIGSAYWTVDQTENGPVAQYSFDENYIWNLEMVERRDINCYLVVNGDIWYDEWTSLPVGATPVAPEWFYEELRGLYKLTPNVDVITEETDEVYFTATWNGPFKLSESYEKAQWYNMTIRGDYYVAMDATEPYYPSVDKELEAEESLWAFLPDENDPFRVRVINHAAGPDMNLAEDGDYPVMRDYEFYWNIYENNDGFVLGSEWDDNAWINQRGGNGGYLGFWWGWNGRYDEGSTFRVYEAEYNEFPEIINVRSRKTLDLAGKQIPADYRPDINVQQIYNWVGNSENPTTLGALNIIATDTTELKVNNLTMSFYPAQTNYFRNQWNTPNLYYTPQHTTLIAEGPVSAEAITISMALTDGQWNFITVPYDVRVSDIYCENEETDWVIRRYDGQARANMQMDATWINVGADEILEPGKGYIMHCSYSPDWLYSSQTFYFPALNTKNKNLIFSDEDRLVALNEYESEFAHNSSWNLIGNPYAAYVEFGATDFNSPITVWDGTGNYLAYSPIDDEYILSPGEAFFVQRPAGQSAIIFDAESRMSWYDTQKGVRYAKSQLRKSNPNRHVFNLFLSDGEQSDRTRVVINPDASMAYENSCDAAKFPAMKRNTTQIYSIASGVDYSINERPLADGTVQLAALFAKTGQYTLRMETSADYSVILTDEATGIAMELNSVDGYTFDALAGDANNRFRLQISKDADAIQMVSTDDLRNARIFTLDGKRIPANKQLSAGVYLIQKNGIVRKASVK